MIEEGGTSSPLFHLSFHLLSVKSLPSIHFLHQVAISHSVHLTLGPLRRSHLPLSLLVCSFSLCRVVSTDRSGRDKVLMLGLKVTAPVLQPHSWGAADPSPRGTLRTAERVEHGLKEAGVGEQEGRWRESDWTTNNIFCKSKMSLHTAVCQQELSKRLSSAGL